MIYYTEIFENGVLVSRIIHTDIQHNPGNKTATYLNYLNVNRKPTYKEAELIFSLVRGNDLTGYTDNKVTIKLEQ